MERFNILTNGDFAEGFSPYRNDEALITADGWAPWWVEQKLADPSWKNRQPRFSRSTLDGEVVQRIDSPYATHTAGIWQQVPAAEGNRYELSVAGQAWSSEDAAAGSRVEPSDVNLQIGIDITGGTDPLSPLITWSKLVQPLSRWETLRLSFEAQANIVTVYFRSAPSLPKRQQVVFWRNAVLLPGDRYKRNIAIVGPGDTHISLEPEHPQPNERVTATVSSMRNHPFAEVVVTRPDGKRAAVLFEGSAQETDRTVWRYTFTPGSGGLYDIRFVSDRGARVLAQRLMRASKQTQLVPSGKPRETYRRVYVLLPPTATEKWVTAAARGGFPSRFTIGFSADDAGVGGLEERYVLAVNPHHWPGVLTETWFRQNYPGTIFTPVVANSPEDLEVWLRNWEADGGDADTNS